MLPDPIAKPVAPEQIYPDINVFCGYQKARWLLPATPREIRQWLLRMAKAARRLGICLEYLELDIVDDGQIGLLNRNNLHVPGPTNILSFPAGAGGSLALSFDTYSRECRLYGQNGRAYLARLLAHGLGHIAGYDHGRTMDAFCHSCEIAALSGQDGV